MTVESLNYFISIMEHKSISKAAESVHISQSALTQVVKKLESDLNCQLLYRSNKGIEPTVSGLLVYEYAKDLIALNNTLLNRLVCLNEGCYSVIIKPCCSMDNQFIPTLIYHLQSEYPNIKLTTEFDNKIKTISEIELGITDFGIVMGATYNHESIDVEIVGFEEVVLVANASLRMTELSVNDLIKHKVIDFSTASYLHDIHKKIEAMTSLKTPDGYKTFMAIDSITSIKTLIQNNFGIAFLPKYTISEELKTGVFQIISLTDFSYKLPIKIISKKDEDLSLLNSNFKRSLIKIAKKYFLQKN